MVLDAQQENGSSVSSAQYQRMVGGVMSNQIASAMKAVPCRAGARSAGARSAGARSAGARSAGAMSGGKLDSLCM
jgi:hypothetical protein